MGLELKPSLKIRNNDNNRDCCGQVKKLQLQCILNKQNIYKVVSFENEENNLFSCNVFYLTPSEIHRNFVLKET